MSLTATAFIVPFSLSLLLPLRGNLAASSRFIPSPGIQLVYLLRAYCTVVSGCCVYARTPHSHMSAAKKEEKVERNSSSAKVGHRGFFFFFAKWYYVCSL